MKPEINYFEIIFLLHAQPDPVMIRSRSTSLFGGPLLRLCSSELNSFAQASGRSKERHGRKNYLNTCTEGYIGTQFLYRS
ncbi:hypothetical protein FOCC_FOCC017047, partial [Frankliniella occidentalis]